MQRSNIKTLNLIWSIFLGYRIISSQPLWIKFSMQVTRRFEKMDSLVFKVFQFFLHATIVRIRGNLKWFCLVSRIFWKGLKDFGVLWDAWNRNSRTGQSTSTTNLPFTTHLEENLPTNSTCQESQCLQIDLDIPIWGQKQKSHLQICQSILKNEGKFEKNWHKKF